MEPEIQSAYQEELQRLEQTAAEIDRQLQTLEQTPRYYGDDLTEQALDNIRESRKQNLRIATVEPYFGRLDFQEQGADAPQPLYIGKVGVEEEDSGKLAVIDWRAPVASMFYSFTGGEELATYRSPEGLIEGLIYLKRNLVIRKQILERVVDAYVKGGDNLDVADEFLLYRLGENKDNRLRDIVSTIQAEQDQIIRSAKNKALVIQGVAGSGKTTVALHRLAYLLYQYRENIRAERMIIFAPNSMFLDYISGVLPELGVGGIQQTTFSDWALDLLDHEVQLSDQSERLLTWFAIGSKRPVLNDEAPGRYKGSLRFFHDLDACLKRLELEFVPERSFEAWEGTSLPAETVREWFHTEYKHYPLAKRRERVVARIKRWLEMELDKVWDSLKRKEWKKQANARLRTYLKALPDLTPFSLYKKLYTEGLTLPEEIRKASLKKFKQKTVDLEDLAPLLLIRNRLHGIDSDHYFDHVVIDEAQDFSPFQVALLKEQTRGHSFSILGDLSQGIHAYQGVRSWREFLDLFDEQEQGYYQLQRSYRSTTEIINFANVVLERSQEALTLAVPVFRSGEKVRVAQVAQPERAEMVIRSVRHLGQGPYNTIAVVTRTEEEASQLHQELLQAGLDAALIHSAQREYKGGLSVLPVYLTKGLEFDAVLLTDVDQAHYEHTAQDAKLLYVGCTRALHELWLIYADQPSALIASMDAELFTPALGI